MGNVDGNCAIDVFLLCENYCLFVLGMGLELCVVLLHDVIM